ncbi:MAG TPA: hypothetical protein DHV14_10220 [Micrococcales bacterium]|uniref:Uncharacterized protein n=1 Tax=Miniimonas arenae TaxID=676201 RepID=A0A5C5BGP2_9MICO|nr:MULTISPECIES: hypothetical protein [Miniimonas]TNU76960.1 hypothetical protein FH969_00990 [Miniimonas arenae]HCX85485.1 hypothetical protein [Micrococcales bacterium]
MPTFTNPTSDADDASEALRGLAHATRTFENPADTYPVIGDLLAGLRSLRQVMDQLATVHLAHQQRVTDDDHNPTAGATAALAAADELHQAATLIDQTHDRLNDAMAHSGRIVWNPEDRLVERWIGVVFLQGNEADTVLDLIDNEGVEAGIDHLSAWDWGNETTEAAMENGDVHDTAPVYAGDRQAETGDYAMTYNVQAGHVALYRRHLIRAKDAIDPAAEAHVPARHSTPARETTGRRSTVREGGWFEHPGVAAVKQARSLSM